MDERDLGRAVDWFGERGVIVAMWFCPTYSVKFEDGRVLTVGEDRVSFEPTHFYDGGDPLMNATHDKFSLSDGGYGCKTCHLCDCHSPADCEKECTGPWSPEPPISETGEAR